MCLCSSSTKEILSLSLSLSLTWTGRRVLKRGHGCHQGTRTGRWPHLLRPAEAEHSFLQQHPKPETHIDVKGATSATWIGLIGEAAALYHHCGVHRRGWHEERPTWRPGNGSDWGVTRMRQNLSTAGRGPGWVEVEEARVIKKKIQHRKKQACGISGFFFPGFIKLNSRHLNTLLIKCKLILFIFRLVKEHQKTRRDRKA